MGDKKFGKIITALYLGHRKGFLNFFCNFYLLYILRGGYIFSEIKKKRRKKYSNFWPRGSTWSKNIVFVDTIEDLNFSLHIHQAQLWPLFRNDLYFVFMFFILKHIKLGRTTCLLTYHFWSMLFTNIGFECGSWIQILNGIYPLHCCLAWKLPKKPQPRPKPSIIALSVYPSL